MSTFVFEHSSPKRKIFSPGIHSYPKFSLMLIKWCCQKCFVTAITVLEEVQTVQKQRPRFSVWSDLKNTGMVSICSSGSVLGFLHLIDWESTGSQSYLKISRRLQDNCIQGARSVRPCGSQFHRNRCTHNLFGISHWKLLCLKHFLSKKCNAPMLNLLGTY